jgi:hypothetical protein
MVLRTSGRGSATAFYVPGLGHRLQRGLNLEYFFDRKLLNIGYVVGVGTYS